MNCMVQQMKIIKVTSEPEEDTAIDEAAVDQISLPSKPIEPSDKIKLELGCWIMLIKKLPTKLSPPKMSIFWSIPWYTKDELPVIATKMLKIIKRGEGFPSGEEFAEFAYEHRKDRGKDTGTVVTEKMEKLLSSNLFNDIFGWAPNNYKARKISYKDEQIKVFPHEYSIIPADRMRVYTGEEGSHELVPSNVAEEKIIEDILNGLKKRIYEQAMIDGCDSKQAFLVANGVDIIENFDIPKLGWYRIRPEYGNVFCYESETEE